MVAIPDRVWERWILCFWWSTWTLADQWLIPFHPWPELLGLALCAMIWVLFSFGWMQVMQENMNRELQQVTQTQDIGPYKRQVEEAT